ncbi:MAG TPA: hypothetical protein VGH16_08610 [Candidatus Binatia bacterium]|jgi:hypothetical protein
MEETFVDTSSLMWGLVFGSIGLGYFVYGKRQKSAVPMLSGVGLMLFPYIVTNPIMLVIIGALLAALPYFISL